jgi:hypothetical protein
MMTEPCGNLKGIEICVGNPDPMQLLLTAAEQGQGQAHLDGRSLAMDRADPAPSQPLTEELLMYGEGFDMMHDDDNTWEFIFEDAVGSPSGNV